MEHDLYHSGGFFVRHFEIDIQLSGNSDSWNIEQSRVLTSAGLFQNWNDRPLDIAGNALINGQSLLSKALCYEFAY